MVWRRPGARSGWPNFDFVVFESGLDTERLEDFEQAVYIFDVWDAAQPRWLIGEQCGGETGQRGVLRAVDVYLAVKPALSVDVEIGFGISAHRETVAVPRASHRERPRHISELSDLPGWSGHLATAPTATAAMFEDAQTLQRARQSGLRTGAVGVGGLIETLESALTRLFCAFGVDFGTVLGGVGEDSDFVRVDLEEASADEILVDAVTDLDSQLAGREGGDQRCVIGQNSEFA